MSEEDNPNKIEKKEEEEVVISRETLLALSIAYLSVFIDILGVSIILPVIPFLALKFDATAQQIGFIYAGYAGAQMVSVPISGKLSDRYGRRPLMMLSLFGSFAGFLFQGLAWNVLSFILARVLAGLFGGSIPICQSYIADVIPVQQRGRYFAILGSVIAVAFLFGPGIGAGLAEFSLQTPMLVASCIAGCGLVLAFFFFKESPRNLKEQDKEVGDHYSESNNIEEGNDRDDERQSNLIHSSEKYASSNYLMLVRSLWLVSFCNMLGFSSIVYFFALFVYDQFNWGTLEVGFTTMLMGIYQVTIQILFYPKIQNWIGKHGCGILGSTSSCLGLLLFGFVSGDAKDMNGLALMAFAIAFASLGNALSVPALSATISRYTSQSNQGANLGVAQSAEALARTVGPLLWGAIYETSRHLPFQISTGVYFTAGVLFVVVLLKNYSLPEHKHLDDRGEEYDNAIESTLSPDSPEHQIQTLLAENKILRQRLSFYEGMFGGENIDMAEVMEIQRL